MVLRNVGPAATQVGIEASGGAGAFSIGGKCHAVVRFQPTAAGLRKATLSMFGDGEGGQQILLLGTAVDPGRPTAVPSAHAFSLQHIGTASPTQRFTFTNESAVATDLSSTTLGGENRDQFRGSHDGCSESSLAPWASCQVGVRFAPDEAGMQSATLRLAGTGGVATVALSGFAEAAAGVDAAQSAAPLRVALHLAGHPLHLTGARLRVGALACASVQTCQVVARATIVRSGDWSEPDGRRSVGPWSTTLTIPAGAKRNLVLSLPAAAQTAARSGRLRVRWESWSGPQRSQGSAEVAVR
jgi:hypothetical protein